MNQLQMINRMLWGGGELHVPAWLATDTSLWLKADNPLNTNIRWYDASPNNHVLNGTATLTDNVFNGQKGYVFNGTSNYFDGGDILDIGTNSRSMIVIGKSNGVTGTFYAKSLVGTAGNRYALVKENNHFISILLWTMSYIESSTSFLKLKSILDAQITLEGRTYQNDVQKGAVYNGVTNCQSTYNFLIGAYNSTSGGLPPYPGYYLNGTICEIIFLDRLLTTAENTEVNAYLNTKYGL